MKSFKIPMNVFPPVSVQFVGVMDDAAEISRLSSMVCHLATKPVVELAGFKLTQPLLQAMQLITLPDKPENVAIEVMLPPDMNTWEKKRLHTCGETLQVVTLPSPYPMAPWPELVQDFRWYSEPWEKMATDLQRKLGQPLLPGHPNAVNCYK